LILDFHQPVKNSNVMIGKHENGRTCKLHEEATKSYNQKITVLFRYSKKHVKINSRFTNDCMKNKQFHNFHTVTLQTYLEYVDQSLLEPTTKALEQQSFSFTLPGLQLPYQWIWFSTEAGFDFPAHVFNGCFVTTPLLPYRARMHMFFACVPTRSQTQEKLVLRVNSYRNS
jgi:hypothetical protein